MDSQFKLANLLSKAIGYSSIEQSDELEKIVISIISKPLNRGNPLAKLIKATLPNLGEKEPLEIVEYEKLYNKLIHESSEGGCIEAQYIKACSLYDEGYYEEANTLYKKSADKGFAKSQWCYGTDLFHGTGGTERNKEQGLFYIELSAGQLYEYALEFLIHSYANGNRIIKKDLAKVEKYSIMLTWLE